LASLKLELVDITYTKEVKWEEAHDNLVLGFRPYVYRHRKFQTGRVVTDTIAGYNHGIELGFLECSGLYRDWYDHYGPLIYRDKYEDVYDSDANVVVTASLGVVGADVSRLTTVGSYDKAYDSADNGEAADIYGNIFNAETAVNGRWYLSVATIRTFTACIDPSPDYEYASIVKDRFGTDGALICMYATTRLINVPFLWIDGQKIVFENNFKREVTTTISDLTTSQYKKAKLFKLDGVMHIYDRDFHYEMTDTIYQWEGEVPEEYQKYVK
jgi:hypothetical protein